MEATAALEVSAFDAALIDEALPGGALRWLTACRKRGEVIPVVLLCRLGDDRQVLAGYRAGANLCIQRPVSGRVLAAHLRALLAPRDLPVLRLGDLSLDPARRQLHFPDGSHATLVERELRLLLVLAKSLDRPVPRERLAEAIWPGAAAEEKSENALHTVVGRLRRRFGEFGWMIRPVRPMGYVLRSE